MNYQLNALLNTFANAADGLVRSLWGGDGSPVAHGASDSLDEPTVTAEIRMRAAGYGTAGLNVPNFLNRFERHD